MEQYIKLVISYLGHKDMLNEEEQALLERGKTILEDD